MEHGALYGDEIERAVCSVICRENGLRAKEIAQKLDIERRTVNHVLYKSPLLHELCYQDNDFRWHGIIRQTCPHTGLGEFSGFYASARDMLALNEEEWLQRLLEGCGNIGRSLNDTRGLLHSFRDCRSQVVSLFADLRTMLGEGCLGWETAFEFRIKKARGVRIYADVLIVTEHRVFSLEFKMKDRIEREELLQAAKYSPYLEIVFGPEYEIIPVLVLTRAHDLFSLETAGRDSFLVPVCSGDMLFNVFDEYMGFLSP